MLTVDEEVTLQVKTSKKKKRSKNGESKQQNVWTDKQVDTTGMQQ